VRTMARRLRNAVQSVVDDFGRIAGSVSIRIKVLGMVLGTIVVLSAILISQSSIIVGDLLHEQLVQQVSDMTVAVPTELIDAVRAEDSARTQAQTSLLLESFASHSDLIFPAYMAVINAAGQLTAEAYARDFSRDSLVYSFPPSRDVIVREMIVQTDFPVSGTDSFLRVGFSMQPVSTLTSELTLRLVEISLIMIIVGFAAASLLTWILTRPILELVTGTQQVRKGNFGYRVVHRADDEIGVLSTAFNSMAESLEQAQAEQAERENLRKRYLSGVILAQENERQRIARELHDSVSQSLTSLLVGLQNLRTAQAASDQQSQISSLHTIITQTLDETRSLAWQLRPSALDELGLEGALERYVQDYQARYPIRIDLLIRQLPPKMAPEVETTVYRIVQEGLTNIARYAHTETASVLIAQRDGHIQIIIEDNGVGFDVSSVMESTASLGLKGMHERAGLFNGTLKVESQPGAGTTLFITIPCDGLDGPEPSS